jgi:hypothetical protein
MNTTAPTFNDLIRASKRFLRSVPAFAQRGTGLRLRPYQAAPLPTILRSIDEGLGLSIVIIFPRQSGKDELIANLKAFLMCSLSLWEHSIVEVNPTYKPQTINAIMRLETRMNMNPVTFTRWRKRSDFIRQVGLCRTSFLSGDGQANVVGATASLLLIINEAQDIEPAVYDKKFAPMCASTNATKIFCGTVWTSTTLLAREMRSARQAQEKDGIQRLFVYDADDVARYHKPYGRHVAGQIAALGRQNPMVRTQYFNEEIDAQAGMFNARRLALIQADQPAQDQPTPGKVYAFLIDVGGQDEYAGWLHATTAPVGDTSRRQATDLDGLGNPGRDYTTLSIVDIDLATLSTLQAPTYRVVHRQAWQGVNHLTVFGALKSLAEAWNPMQIVIDATGVGEGLWALLDKAFPLRTIAVKFTQQAKSEIGWGFISIIETGRFRDCSGAHARTATSSEPARTATSGSSAPCGAQERPTQPFLPHEGQTPLANEVYTQYVMCQSEILPGPARTLRWGVRDGTRGPDGLLVHDDYLLADSLTAILDKLDWHIQTAVVQGGGFDPLENIL